MEHFGSKILDLVCNVQINKKGKGFKEYVPRRARTASTAVVVGTTIQTTVLFLTVTHGVKKLRKLEAILAVGK